MTSNSSPAIDLPDTELDSQVENEELKEVLRHLSPTSRRKVFNFAKKLESPPRRSISILMTGKTGAGKSALTNGIIGMKIAPEGTSIRTHCTKQVNKYVKKKDHIDVTVWDSPGLQDGTDHQEEYLEQMVMNCSQVDLTLYCIRMSETRFVHGHENPDVVAMARFTKAFGTDFWKNTIIVLTFANVLEALHVEWDDLSPKKKEEAFKAKIKEWEEQIREILISDIKVPADVVHQIKVLPAGHYRKPKLPSFGHWLSNLWFECVSTIPNEEARLTMLKINKNRLKREKEVRKEDFEQKPEEQPLIISDEMIEQLIKQGNKMGALLGRFVAGPVGETVGSGVGYVLGTLAGMLIKYFTK